MAFFLHGYGIPEFIYWLYSKCAPLELGNLKSKHHYQVCNYPKSIFTQTYLQKCEDIYFIFQNKYLCIYKHSFGAKILGDDCGLNLSDQYFCVRSFLFHVSIHKRRFAKQVPQLSIKPFPRYYIFSLSLVYKIPPTW